MSSEGEGPGGGVTSSTRSVQHLASCTALVDWTNAPPDLSVGRSVIRNSGASQDTTGR